MRQSDRDHNWDRAATPPGTAAPTRADYQDARGDLDGTRCPECRVTIELDGPCLAGPAGLVHHACIDDLLAKQAQVHPRPAGPASEPGHRPAFLDNYRSHASERVRNAPGAPSKMPKHGHGVGQTPAVDNPRGPESLRQHGTVNPPPRGAAS